MRTYVCRRGLTGHLLSLLLLTIMSVNKAVAAAPAGYSEFYIPGDEDNMMYIMSTLGNLSGTQTGSGMHTIISVVASSDNTIVYYDHWEDGYDFDPNDPAVTADETQTLNQGGVYTFESASIAIPRSSAVTVYDGRDRVYVAGGVPTVTRTSWVENVGPVQALSWEVYPVRPQMITYRIPFGEDLANPAGKDYQDFERVFGLIQATEDGTEITIDINNDGTPDLIDGDHDGNFDGQSITLNAGEVYRFDNSSVALYLPPLPPLNFSYDFEAGSSGFTTGADIPYTDNNNSPQQFNWELGNPDTVVPANSNNCSSNCFGNGGPADCSSGNQCWGTDLDDLYINDLNDSGSGSGRVYLISPVYDFSGYSTIQLSFAELLDIEGDGYDQAILQYSINGGAWTDTWVYGDDESTRVDTAWSTHNHDASGYAADQASVQWRWAINTDYTWQYAGWYIDDVQVDATTSSPVAAGMLTGATIRGSDTLQVQYVIGDEGANYELRGLSSFPKSLWDDEYYAPVSGAANQGAPVDIYFFNPNSENLIIDWETDNGTGSFTVNPGETLAFSEGTGGYVPQGSAVYVKGSDVFWGVSTIDSEDQVYDWGYSLIPALLLEREHFIGWAPGSTTPGSSQDDSGVYITGVQDNTRVFVDFDADSVVDQTITIDRLQSTYIFDTTDGDMTGARLWATGAIAMSYGQNPDTAATATPAIDVGYVTVPGGSLIERVIAVDKTANPGIIPLPAGAQSTFNIVISSYEYAMTNVSAVDFLPAGWEYVAGSTIITRADYTTSSADPTISGSELNWSSLDLGSLAPYQHITISFTAQTTQDFGVGDVSTNNTEVTAERLVGGFYYPFTASDFAYVTFGELEVTKTSSGVDPLSPGEQFTYTITVANPGTETLTGITIYDPLPPGVEYVAGSGRLFGYAQYLVSDSISVSGGYANNDGLIQFTTDWIENDSDNNGQDPSDGYVRIVSNATNGELRLRRGNGSGRVAEIERQLSLDGIAGNVNFTFDYRTSGNLENNDEAEVAISADGNSFTVLETFNNDSSGSRSFAIPANMRTNSTTIRFRINNYYGGSGEYFYVDNVEIHAESVQPLTNVPTRTPPGLVSSDDGYVLGPASGSNNTMTISFDVIVDDPLATGIGTIVNTAFVSADQFPQPVSASVTNVINNTITDSASISGRVWFDEDRDGIEDIGEAGFAGIPLILRDSDDIQVASTTTSGNGNYIFSGITPGNGYYVEIPMGSGNPLAGLIQTAPSGHTDDQSDAFDLVAGEELSNIDFGYATSASTATLGDTVWHDSNNNGIQDSGEPGIAGVTITLYLDDGDEIFGAGDTPVGSPVVTGSDGRYLFTDIAADGSNDYFVEVTLPAGYSIDPGEEVLPAVDLLSGAVYLAYDFGLQTSLQTYTIVDKIFYDENQNGLFDGSESGLANVTVDLLDASGFYVGTTVSNGAGDFSFTGIPGDGADYSLRITDTAGILSSYFGTTAAALAGEVAIINLYGDYTAQNFGYGLSQSAGGTVFRDLGSSPNGVQDPGDPGIAGVTVLLYADDGDSVFEPGGDDGSSIASVTTNINGDFIFSGLQNGQGYFIEIDNSQPEITGLILSTTDYDTGSPGHQLFYTMGDPGELSLDFGYFAPDNLQISGYIWEDDDILDGQVDGSEPRFANVTVTLTNTNGDLLDTQVTDALGYYEFSSLQAGTYTVRVTDQNVVLSGMRTVYEVTEGLDMITYDSMESVIIAVGSNSVGINFGYRFFDPTYALISSFDLFQQDGKKVVEWHTKSEVNTRGFDLLRRSITGEYITINSQIIPADLSARQSIYQVLDPGMSESGQNEYILREHQIRGIARTYGPFVVTLAGSSAMKTLLDDLESYGFSSRKEDIVQQQDHDEEPALETMQLLQSVTQERSAQIAADQSAADVVIKVGTSLPGVHAVTVAELATNCPLEEGTITDLILAGRMTISNKGNNIAYVSDEGATTIYFYASEHSTVYSDENIYRISFQPQTSAEDMNDDGAVSIRDAILALQVLAGMDVPAFSAEFPGSSDSNYNGRLDAAEVVSILRGIDSDDSKLMTSVSGGNPSTEVSGPISFRKSLHVEQDLVAGLSLPVSPDYDYWLWADFYAGPGSEIKTFTFNVEDNEDSTVDATITVNLYGVSTENSVSLILNEGSGSEIDLGTVTWNGPGMKRYQQVVKNNELLSGINSLKISRVDSGENRFALDSIDLSYTKTFTAQQNRLLFTAEDLNRVTISGFTTGDIIVFDINDTHQPVVISDTLITEDSGDFRVTFDTQGDKHDYVALTFDAALQPTSIELDIVSDLKAAANRGAYLIITSEKFASAAQILADYRTGDGLEAKVVLLSDIFDEFNFGIYNPLAIREFIKYSSTYWTLPPQYVLLVGNGTYDYKNIEGADDNYMPALMSDTPDGLFPADNMYTDLDDDGKLDLPVGRITATTSSDLMVMIGKIIDYETGSASHEVIFAADSDHANSASNFSAESDGFAALLGGQYIKEKIYVSTEASPQPPYYDAADAKTALIDGINKGPLFLNYSGHGIWFDLSDASIFSISDSNLLTNEAYPIVTALTCLVGDFSLPGADSLAEVMTKKPGGGFVAVWSPSGISENSEAKKINDNFLRIVFDGEQQRLGDAILTALTQYSQAEHLSYMLNIFNLIGDPALKIRLHEQ